MKAGEYVATKIQSTYFFIRSDMASKLDLAKGALADRFSQDILAYFALVRQQLHIRQLLLCLVPDLVCITDRFVNGCRSLGHLDIFDDDLARRGFLLAESVRGDDGLSVVEEVYHCFCWVLDHSSSPVSRARLLHIISRTGREGLGSVFDCM